MWLYVISNRLGNRRGWPGEVERISEASAAGCQLIQVRERDLPAGRLSQMTREAIEVARPYGAKVLVNDRLDVALASRADGVHLRATSLPVSAVRQMRDQRGLDSFLIGVSTHSLTEAQTAEEGGATFIVAGPVFSPNSKSIEGPPMGLDQFEKICQRVSVPVIALGGIGRETCRDAMAAGAAGIAAIGLFQEARDLSALVGEIFNDPQSHAGSSPPSRQVRLVQ